MNRAFTHLYGTELFCRGEGYRKNNFMAPSFPFLERLKRLAPQTVVGSRCRPTGTNPIYARRGSVQLDAEADAARLRPGAEAPRIIKT